MTPCTTTSELLIDFDRLTEGERAELTLLGILSYDEKFQEFSMPRNWPSVPDWRRGLSVLRKSSMKPFIMQNLLLSHGVCGLTSADTLSC